jgi:large conductance mechanosensitive channel
VRGGASWSHSRFEASHAAEKAWTLLDEFKAFAFKGNVVDLAIGVIGGGVFHNFIDSLLKNLILA